MSNLPSGCLSAVVARIFLKMRAWRTTHIHTAKDVSLLSAINNYGHFTWRAVYLRGCISASIGGILPKIHVALHAHSPTTTKVCWGSMNISGHFKSNTPSRLYLSFHQKNFPENSCLRCKFVWNRWIIKDSLREQHCTFRAAFRFPLVGFSLKFISKTSRSFPTNSVSLVVYGRALVTLPPTQQS